VLVSTREGEYNKDFDSNTIRIDRWKGELDTKMLDLLNFFSNLYFMNIKDWRNTISSYKCKNFFRAFDKVQKKVFKQMNIFTLNPEEKYRKRVEQVNSERINEFLKGKALMDEHIRKEKSLGEESFVGRTVNLCRGILFRI
jgi:hypothetical protein